MARMLTSRGGVTSTAGTAADRWDAKLRKLGHRPVWLATVGPAYVAECTVCGRWMRCGAGRASGSLRTVRCPS